MVKVATRKKDTIASALIMASPNLVSVEAPASLSGP